MDHPHTIDVHRIGDDPDVLEAFYREHLASVQRFVARRVSDPHLAADLTGDVFLAAIDSARSYLPDRATPGGWLMGVARNVVAAEFRRQHRHRTAERRIAGRRLLDADALARIEDRIDAERESRELHAALAAVPERDRALIELVALDGLSVTEAAAVLGVKPATARVRLHRSRARVQNHLRPPLAEAVAALNLEVQP